MGICRGNQIINASSGGTLIPDIPSFIESAVDHNNKLDSAHIVIGLKGSWLSDIGEDTLWVNSRHHQCVDEVSPLFSPAAYSPDGVIESIQIPDSLLHPFAVGIQWHPEGLLDSPSMKIANLFISKVLAN